MTKTIRLSSALSLPLDFATQSCAILAKRRAGKSYTARRIVEQLVHAEIQVIVLDPKGDWWGARSSADGKSPGLPLTIFGGEHGDVPLTSDSGETLAAIAVEEQLSMIVDLSEFRKHELATFAAAFLEALYRLKAREAYRSVVMVVVDEGDAIAPQKPQPNEARMLGAAEDLVRRGGQRGIGTMFITQRSAVLNKNVLTQAQILIALRTIAPQDLAAMNAWIDVHGEPEQRKLLMSTLPSLPIGEAWVWAPGWPTADGIFQRVKVDPIETFDSGATPKPGEKRSPPRKVAPADIDRVKDLWSHAIEVHAANDPKALRARIETLEKQRAAAAGSAGPLGDDFDPEDSERLWTLREIIDSEIGWADSEEAEGGDYAARLREVASQLRRPAISEMVLSRLEHAANHVQKSCIEAVEAARDVVGALPSKLTSFPHEDPGFAKAADDFCPKPPAVVHRDPKLANGATKIGAGERKILTAIAQHRRQGVTREQLTVLTGYKRSSRDTYLQRLGAASLIENVGGNLVVTELGRAELGDSFRPLPTGRALLKHWLAELPEGERKILDLVARHPQGLQRERISTETGYKRSSRDTYLQRLGARRLVRADGGNVRLAPELV